MKLWLEATVRSLQESDMNTVYKYSFNFMWEGAAQEMLNERGPDFSYSLKKMGKQIGDYHTNPKSEGQNVM